MKRFYSLVALLVALAPLIVPSLAYAQAQTPTTVNVSGGSQGASQTVPTGEARFGLRVPLKPNAENTLSLVATDTDGRTAKVDNLKIAQISLTEIVQARVTATRLSTPEVKQLVAEGVINLQDPDNYNVSRFVVALVVNGREVQVPVPVVRHKQEIVAEGPPDEVMEDPAVVDAYLGAHQDLDLGAVTGRIPVIESDAAARLREQIEAEAEAELEATSTADPDQKGNA